MLIDCSWNPFVCEVVGALAIILNGTYECGMCCGGESGVVGGSLEY